MYVIAIIVDEREL